MEKDFSVQLLTSIVKDLQQSCLKHLHFDRFVEVGGYLTVEIDNTKKERYVLSEIMQSGGSVVSESFCVEGFRASNSKISSNSNWAKQSIPRRGDNSEEDFRGSGYKYRKLDEHGQHSETLQSHEERDVRGSPDRNPYYQLEPLDQDTLHPSSDNCPVTAESESLHTHSTTSDNDEYIQGNVKPEVQFGHDSTTSNSYCGKSEEVYQIHSRFSPDSVSVHTPQHAEGKRQHSEMHPKRSSSDAASCSYQIRTMKVEDVIDDDGMTLPVAPDQSPSCDPCPRECYVSLPPSRSASETMETYPFPQEGQGCVTDITSTSAKSEESFDSDGDSQCIVLDGDGPRGSADPSPLCMQATGDHFQTTSSSSSQPRKTQFSPGTLTVVNSAVKLFKKFHHDKSGLEFDLLTTPPDTLNNLLLEYISGAQKSKSKCQHDNKTLAAKTLKNILCYVEMYLRDGGYPFSIWKGIHFQPSRDFVKNKLLRSGKTASKKPEPVNGHDIELMFEKHILGTDNPETLSNTVWLFNSLYLGVRRPAEHFNLKWGDITLEIDDQGHEYLDRKMNKFFSLKVYANLDKPNRCFVAFYKLYRERRPKLARDPECAFYLKICKNPDPDGDLWFLPEPMLWFAVSGVWRKIAVAAGLPSNKKII